MQPELFLVGQADGRIVATVLGGYDGHRGWVYRLAVASQMRRRGVGKQMMAAIEQKLHALGCPKINLQVRANNTEVVQFYQELGYHIEDHISMGKLLATE